MGTDFQQRRRALSVLALVATIGWSAITNSTTAARSSGASQHRRQHAWSVGRNRVDQLRAADRCGAQRESRPYRLLRSSAINCIRAIPYVRMGVKYQDSGLVVIGVHTPEFDIEKLTPNVQKAVNKFGVTYPVAIDSNKAIWKAFTMSTGRLITSSTYREGAVRALRRGELTSPAPECRNSCRNGPGKPMPAGAASVVAQGVEEGG